MLEAFLPMREWLERGIEPLVTAAPVQEALELEVQPEPEQTVADDVDAAVSDARRFRAALADAVAMCVEEVLRDIAGDVLARELILAPCDLHAIVVRAVERYGDEPVRIRAHPSEAHQLERSGAIVVPDETLRTGDVTLETRHGSVDASLGVRLERVLARCAS